MIDSSTIYAKLKRMKSLLRLVIILALSFPMRAAHAEGSNASREFLMSCTYGVLAGTLVGAASLAFTDKPGDNLNRVARGASIGLYAGILLGAYVVYFVPEEEPDGLSSQSILIYPTLSPEGVDGAAFDWTITRF